MSLVKQGITDMPKMALCAACFALTITAVLVGCSKPANDTNATIPSLTFDTRPSTSIADSSTSTDSFGDNTPDTSATPATTTETSPLTTEPLAIRELILRGNGIGSAFFGAEPEGVIGYVSSILGGNTGDTGWVDPFTFAACPGTAVRKVDWGVLSLLFGDESDIASGRQHFIGWEYGTIGQIGDEPVGLRTEGRTALGSSIVDLVEEFPDVLLYEGDDDIGFLPHFYVSDVFTGLLTGTASEDVVMYLSGGLGCDE